MKISINTSRDGLIDTRVIAGKEEALAVLAGLCAEADCEIEVEASPGRRALWIQIMDEGSVMVDGDRGILVGDPERRGHVGIIHSNGEEDEVPARFAVDKARAAEVLSAVLDQRPMDPSWTWEAYEFGDA